MNSPDSPWAFDAAACYAQALTWLERPDTHERGLAALRQAAEAWHPPAMAAMPAAAGLLGAAARWVPAAAVQLLDAASGQAPELNNARGAAMLGDPTAQVEFALRQLCRGETQEARHWLERAATQGSATACFWLAEQVDQAPDERRRLLELAAQAAHPEAMALLAKDAWTRGEPVTSLRWLERAAEAGEPGARYELGRRLLFGEGAPFVLDAARAWLSSAALAGHGLARRLLAQVPDLEAATRLGSMPAWAELARLREEAGDLDGAIAAYRQAAVADEGARKRLEAIAFDSAVTAGFSLDALRRALELHPGLPPSLATTYPHRADACYTLASALDRLRDPSRPLTASKQEDEDPQAAKWYLAAAGHVPERPAIAVAAWFRLAALVARDPTLAEVLAETPTPDALALYRRAAALATSVANKAFRPWKAGDRSPELAASLAPIVDGVRRLAGEGDLAASYVLGVLLYEGIGVPRDLATSRRCLAHTAEQGHVPAACLVAMLAQDNGEPPATYWTLYRNAARLATAPEPNYLMKPLLPGPVGLPRDAGDEAGWRDFLRARPGMTPAALGRASAYGWAVLGAALGNEAARTEAERLRHFMAAAEIALVEAATAAWWAVRRAPGAPV
jgi:TPR repeat protein